MVTICKLFKTSLAKNGTLFHQEAKVFLLPACLLSAAYFAVVNSTKDLAGLKMPLSILHPQKDYLICSKKKKKKHPPKKTLYSCLAGITSCISPNINWGKVSECFFSLLYLQPVLRCTFIRWKSELHTKETDKCKFLRVSLHVVVLH